MIYKILKHSLPSLSACQENRRTHILGGGVAPLSPAGPSTRAALKINTQKPAASPRMSISLYPSKHQDGVLHSEME